MDEFYNQLSDEILDKLGIDKSLIITKKYSLSIKTYITSIISTYSAEDARKLLGVSEDTIRRFTTKYLRDKFPEWKPGASWYIILLNYIGYKRCNSCNLVYFSDQNMFGANITRAYGLSGTCRVCDAERGKVHRDYNRDYYREYAKQYYKNNKEYFIYYNSIRRAREVQALPDWVDTSELLNIYLARPKGTHVDHIIPLVNRWVCGLHVPNNLQYLSAEDNRRKYNKFDIEKFNLKYYNS